MNFTEQLVEEVISIILEAEGAASCCCCGDDRGNC
jgi:hypothetical protein